MSFVISCHLRFRLRVIGHFMSFEIFCHLKSFVICHFVSFDISCHLTFCTISHFVSFDISCDLSDLSHYCNYSQKSHHSIYVQVVVEGRCVLKKLERIVIGRLAIRAPSELITENMLRHFLKKTRGGEKFNISLC